MEFNDTTAHSGAIFGGNFFKENSLTLIIIFIATTFLELLMLIVTCVYYRRRINGILPKKKNEMKEGVEMRINSFNNRESKALSFLRYVMDPTSLKQADYAYVTCEELGIPKRDVEDSTELKSSPKTESERNDLSQTLETIKVALIQEDDTRAPLATEKDVNSESERQEKNCFSLQEKIARAETNAPIETKSEANGLSQTPAKIQITPTQIEGARAKTCDKVSKQRQNPPKPRQKIPQNKTQVPKSRQQFNTKQDNPFNFAEGDELTNAKTTSDENGITESKKFNGCAKEQNKADSEKTNARTTNTGSHTSTTIDTGTIKQDSESCSHIHSLYEKKTENKLQDTTYENF